MHREPDSQPKKKNGGKRFCCLVEEFQACSRTLSHGNPIRFHGRAQHSWDQTTAWQFSKGTLRHKKIRERKGPSQGVIQHAGSLVRSRKTPKIKDRSQEEILKQERCARRDAWEMAKGIFKLKEQDRATFFSPSDVWCLTAPSSTTRGKRICGRFRSLNAHAEQERSPVSGTGHCFEYPETLQRS